MKYSITKLIKTHNKALKQKPIDENFLQRHIQLIEIIKHERLIHLIVTMFTMLFDLIFILLFYVSKEISFLILFVILLILSVFYFAHYFFLENTLTKWYFLLEKKD